MKHSKQERKVYFNGDFVNESEERQTLRHKRRNCARFVDQLDGGNLVYERIVRFDNLQYGHPPP